MLSPFQEEKEFHCQRWKWLRCHPSALHSQAPSSQDQLLGPVYGEVLVVIVTWWLWCLPRYCCVLGSYILSSGRSIRKIIWHKDILRLVKYRFPISYAAHSWLPITIPSIMCVVNFKIDWTYFSQKYPNWGWVWPQRCGSWKATYKKNGESVDFWLVRNSLTRSLICEMFLPEKLNWSNLVSTDLYIKTETRGTHMIYKIVLI